jgi:hypothetical protein
MYGWNVNVGPSSLGKRLDTRLPHGLFAGTLVAGESGWCPVERLSAGDKVCTFDDGLQTVRDVRTRLLWNGKSDEDPAPVVVEIPGGALANERNLTLLPWQALLLECEMASDAMGDPYAMIPVAALEGVCSISRASVDKPMVLHRLIFDTDQAVYIDSGLIAHCQKETRRRVRSTRSRYAVKSPAAAKALLTDLDLAELAVREPDDEFFGDLASGRVA